MIIPATQMCLGESAETVSLRADSREMKTLEEMGLREAKLVAERIRHLVEVSVIALVTVSIGGSAIPPGREFERLFAEADSALYSSKSNGRNMVTLC